MTCTGTKHGDANAYWNWKCRCPEARADALRAAKRYKYLRANGAPASQTRFVPAEPYRRRVRALARMGWPQREIMSRLGRSPNRRASGGTGSFLGGQRISRENAAQLGRLYDELCMVPGPSAWTRTYAARQGWPGPLDWDNIDDLDEVPYAQRVEAVRREQRLEYDRARKRKVPA